MDVELPEEIEIGDRRVRRSRSALLSAAVRLVTERESAEVSVTELAEAANVSRQLLYQHFGDRDALLVAAAVELVRRELLPRLPSDLEPEAANLAMAAHFAEHRRFYRAVLDGTRSYTAIKAVCGLFRPYNAESARLMFGGLDARSADEVARFLTGAAAMELAGWLVDGADPLDPREFADRMLRIRTVLTGEHPGRTRPHGESA